MNRGLRSLLLVVLALTLLMQGLGRAVAMQIDVAPVPDRPAAMAPSGHSMPCHEGMDPDAHTVAAHATHVPHAACAQGAMCCFFAALPAHIALFHPAPAVGSFHVHAEAPMTSAFASRIERPPQSLLS